MIRLSIQARQALGKLTLPVLILVAFGLMLLGKADAVLVERARMALADALEEAGIVENDRLIVSWDGSRLLKDAATPRIEVMLEAVE